MLFIFHAFIYLSYFHSLVIKDCYIGYLHEQFKDYKDNIMDSQFLTLKHEDIFLED